MKRTVFTTTILILVVMLFVTALAYAFNLPKFFGFNRRNALEEWEEKIFKNKVIYTVEHKAGEGYLNAESDRACSGLIYKMKFSPRNFPMMSWGWKVIKFPDKNKLIPNDSGWIEKDDYAARVYVIFSGFSFMQTRSIEYIWDETLPEGTIFTSPYFKNIKLIVAESGSGKLGEWVIEQRNILDDYKKAFGSPPLMGVAAIAIMTDTDNTLSTAEAQYKDIKVGYKNE
ncbi:MAG: DUF3047 domain-containing protein [Candidatus Omnitrophota bacterium]